MQFDFGLGEGTPMEVYRRRRTDPWVWVAIVAIVAIALLFIVWFATADSRKDAQREREQQEQMAREEEQLRRQPQETADDQEDRVIIRDQERVREIVRERPVYIYEEPREGSSDSPRSVVVVPRESEAPSGDYERVDVPGRFESNGREYIVQTGMPVRGDSDEFISTGRQADGHTIYYRRGTEEPRDTLYLKIRPDSDIYIPYELSPQ